MEYRSEEKKKQTTIGDIASVVSGQILTRVTNKTGEGETVPLLTPKAITAGIINKADLGEAVLSKPVSDERYTREGDIALKLSAPYAAAYVTKDMAGLLVPSFCALIRVAENAMVDAKYLSAFLNTSYVKKLLASMVVGSTAAMAPISGIRALKIPEISSKDMEDIGEAYMLSGQKRIVLGEMIKTEEKLMESIVLASIKEVD